MVASSHVIGFLYRMAQKRAHRYRDNQIKASRTSFGTINFTVNVLDIRAMPREYAINQTRPDAHVNKTR